ncbi:MAG: glutamine--tRNA ligase/YqeY domain fusion protein [Planctomycetota bacterium]|nr:MAG: glutamine--tRNA ligase/YqeY domain fusion protein [Planctomycetota bacterium]
MAENFIRDIIKDDLAAGRHQQVVVRFPPEPNGYLHIGHAKAICLNFGLPEDFPGRCHLRFDDTNPTKEEMEYVEAIQEDIRWLGFDWGEHLYYASDYFDQLHEWAIHLIREGKAYVESLSAEQIREYRGTLTEPGRNSPFRDRPIEENLELFAAMGRGELEEGSHVLRAKIDMASPNMNMRDPTLYRIRKASHHRTGDKWCIYPMYDFTHGQSDAMEGITHSLCSLEFENHRPLYDWFLENLPVPHRPRQIEFARLNLNRTVMSKRKLLQLVENGHVEGWNDPRMPTLSGMRRRGVTATAIRNFCDVVGVAKRDSMVDIALLEHCLREDLNAHSPRRMAVLDPLKVVIDNYPEGQVEQMEAENIPGVAEAGTRKVPFSKVLYIEKEDFREQAPRKYFRMKPGQEVRLRYAYYVTCTEVVKNDAGEVVEIHCRYDPESKGGNTADGRRVKGTIHWVSADHALAAEVRQYGPLFLSENPAAEEDFLQDLNPDSLTVLTAQVEPGLAEAEPGSRFQFERKGYYCVDTAHSQPGKPVFNLTVGLRDSWAKIESKERQKAKA